MLELSSLRRSLTPGDFLSVCDKSPVNIKSGRSIDHEMKWHRQKRTNVDWWPRKVHAWIICSQLINMSAVHTRRLLWNWKTGWLWCSQCDDTHSHHNYNIWQQPQHHHKQTHAKHTSSFMSHCLVFFASLPTWCVSLHWDSLNKKVGDIYRLSRVSTLIMPSVSPS